jgi:hypothetical protein
MKRDRKDLLVQSQPVSKVPKESRDIVQWQEYGNMETYLVAPIENYKRHHQSCQLPSTADLVIYTVSLNPH